MVRRIALKTIRSLPRTITLDDIISAGWVGMSEALRRRPEGMPQEQFEAYSSYRIRGAILDYLRHLDPLSRRLRGIARQLTRVTSQLTQKLGHLPDQEQIAEGLEMTLEQYQAILVEMQEAGLDRIDANAVIEPPARTPSPESLASHSEILSTVETYSKNLSERLQMVLSLHYEHECSLREIGDILGVTESRVCQLHSEAVQRIRAQFEGKPASSVRRRRNKSQPN
jgi:RNA polymerase sigma factor for flagellar operon FliA